jgi:molecular chaperone DnaJ
MSENHYQTLGVSPDADAATIRTAYRRLAQKWHPDRLSKAPEAERKLAEERLKDINRAYAVLSDDARKQAYDARTGFGGFAADDEADGDDDFDSGPSRHQRQSSRRNPPPKPPEHGRDLFVKATTDVQTVLRGGYVRVGWLADDDCPLCDGTGFLFHAYTTECPECGGIGCYACSGRGRARARTRCPWCTGRGYLSRDHLFEVTVPARTHNGCNLRLLGKGGPGFNGGAPGDLYCIIQVKKHKLGHVRGLNVYTEIRIDCIDAMLGATRTFEVLGSDLQIKIPAGTRAGKYLRLAGQGLRSGDGSGDLVLHVSIDIPKGTLSDKQRLHLRRFAGLEPEPSTDQEQARPATTRHPESEPLRASERETPRMRQIVYAEAVADFHIRTMTAQEFANYSLASKAFSDYADGFYAWRGQKQTAQRFADLRTSMLSVEGINKTLFAGQHAPSTLVSFLRAIRQMELGDRLVAIGNYACLVYASAAGAIITDASRHRLFGKRVQLLAAGALTPKALIDALREVDETFEELVGHAGRFSALNAAGLTIDIIGAGLGTTLPGKRAPSRLLNDESAELEDYGIASLLGDGIVSAVVVSDSGQMERLAALKPSTFIRYKRWASELADIAPEKRGHCSRMAALVSELARGIAPAAVNP